MLFLIISPVIGQSVNSPSEFLGYPLGESFTPHYRVIDYFNYISATSPKTVKLQKYGKTYENRPLTLAFISSETNINRLEEIRTNNLRLSGNLNGKADLNQPAIVWLSYNVHGNESVSTEAAMQTLYDLVDPANSKTKAWLKNTVIVIDPCVNPDGRERYVNFYNSVANKVADPTPFSREHQEPWPGGRANHYYFDLNRDWAWQTQMETQQRMLLYNQWLPQIHVDFHEQGINEPYYFAPAAEPFHEDITKWQREFQTIIGKNNAKYFDEKNWLYFTKERFDLLYPSYGDTYPTYNGAIGMTFEQGGSGRAGLAVLTEVGDTLTLKNRIAHHHTTGLSTIEVSSANADRLISEYKNYFEKSRLNPSGLYKTYIIKDDNTGKLNALANLLTKNGIEFGYGAPKGGTGFNYFTGKSESFTVQKSDMVVSAYQPKSVLVKVLFEPSTFVSDSVTYDITAWALPYAYGLKSYATKSVLKFASTSQPVSTQSANTIQKPLAFLANWGSLSDVKFLATLLKKDIKVRYSEVPFQAGGKQYGIGSLIITRTSNENLTTDFEKIITTAALQSGVSVQPLASGFLEKGADLGSDKIRYIKRPRVALIGGDNVSSLAFGEAWHFFEQQINYPVSVIMYANLDRANLNEFDVLIYPNGEYDSIADDKMQNWIKNGGKLIAMENAVAQLAGKKGFSLIAKEVPKIENGKNKNVYAELKSYENRERESIQNSIPGAIYKVDIDNTHPLGFGFPKFYYTLKRDDKLYSFLESGWNVGVLKKNNYVTGFVGNKTKKDLVDGLLFGVEEMGSGSVVYLAENPLFRSFWENGKLLFSNAVFMVGH